MAEPALDRRMTAQGVPAEIPAGDFVLIELLFFAYRDFVSDPDRILARSGLGRAHHRVLHFVDRNPGLTVAELLDILRITKQSLNRVLKELIDQAHIVQEPGPNDRRQRRLFTTPSGHALAASLAVVQSRRISEALSGLDIAARSQIEAFLLGMVDAETRSAVERQVRRPASRRERAA
jgi:DNA-binding MarR family transcriptional regulator